MAQLFFENILLCNIRDVQAGHCFPGSYLSLTTVWTRHAASISVQMSLLVQLDRLSGPGGFHTDISSYSSDGPYLSLCFMV